MDDKVPALLGLGRSFPGGGFGSFLGDFRVGMEPLAQAPP